VALVGPVAVARYQLRLRARHRSPDVSEGLATLPLAPRPPDAAATCPHRSLRLPVLTATAVDLPHLKGIDIHTLHATDIDSSHFGARFRMCADGEGLDAAG
jgi:hypothetical protein